MVVGLVVLSVTLVTSLAFWWEKLGGWGLGVIGAAIIAGFLAVVFMPETAWQRVTGAYGDVELGQLHEEGVALRSELPWTTERDGKEQLDAYQQRLEDWTTRVRDNLDPRWRGTFLSDITGLKTTTSGYKRASHYRNSLDDRLERLSQIMTATGSKR